MANKRNVKKDIEYLTYEVLNDCFLTIDTHPEKDKENIMKIVSDTIAKRNELIARVNVKNLEKKEVKKHFQEIYSDLTKNTDENFQKLSKLIMG
jgi:hypothetical protein